MTTTPAHAIRSRIGSRSHQCDTARARVGAHRAYVLLDGIGSDDDVQTWVRRTATTLAVNAAKLGAELALRRAHERTAKAQRDAGWRDLPAACAAVATVDDGTLTVAWCGDVRAYLWNADGMRRLTADHNMRRILLDTGQRPGPRARNRVYSCLGSHDESSPVDTVTVPAVGRLILASDGAYEPLEDAGLSLTGFAHGPVGTAATAWVQAAIRNAGEWADNATVLITDL